MTDRQSKTMFTGLYNFRDVGGLSLPDGRKMKQGLIFRADELSRLNENGWQQLQKLALKCICDLRAANERKFNQYKLPDAAGMRLVHIPIRGEEREFSRWQFFWFLVCEGRKLDFAEYMCQLYYRLAFERTGQIRTIFTLLADAQNLPVLIHCANGKDRTGFIAALLQLLAGVPQAAVMQSYLASNDMIAPKMQRLARSFYWLSLGRLSAERAKPLLEVRQAYLEQTLAEIYHRYNSLEAYLQLACGVDENCLYRLRSLLIE